MAEKPVRSIPWIKYAYLKQMTEAGGELELEESLVDYDRGVALLASLKERLAEAEQKVQVLLDASTEGAPDTTSAPASAYIYDEEDQD